MRFYVCRLGESCCIGPAILFFFNLQEFLYRLCVAGKMEIAGGRSPVDFSQTYSLQPKKQRRAQAQLI